MNVDRGFVFVTRKEDGSKTVEICASIDTRKPAANETFARYDQCLTIDVQSVEMTRVGRHAWSTQLVEVFPDLPTQAVIVRPVTSM